MRTVRFGRPEKRIFSRVRFSHACALGVGAAAFHAGLVNGERAANRQPVCGRRCSTSALPMLEEDFGDPGAICSISGSRMRASHGGLPKADAAPFMGGRGIRREWNFVHSDARAIEGPFRRRASNAAG